MNQDNDFPRSHGNGGTASVPPEEKIQADADRESDQGKASPTPPEQPVREDANREPARTTCCTGTNSAAQLELVEGERKYEAAFKPPDAQKLFLWFFMGLLLFSLYMLYALMQPFLHSIILAIVFTALSYPLYTRCLRLTGNRAIPAAMIMLLGIALVVASVIVLLISGLIPQAKVIIPEINQWLAGAHLDTLLDTHVQPLLEPLQRYVPEFTISSAGIRESVLQYSRNISGLLMKWVSLFLGDILLFIAHMLIMFLIMFFLFLDGEKHARRLSYLFPLKPQQTTIIMESLRRMAKAVLVGGFCVAVLQGVAGGIGFAIVGLPSLFWGTVMVFAAMVPVVGTGLVWVPAVIYLVVMKEWNSAIFLTAWCGLGVTNLDSLVRPMLMRNGAKLPVVFFFLAIIGGIRGFGIIGLLYGPLILGLAAVLLTIYEEEYKDVLQDRTFQGK